MAAGEAYRFARSLAARLFRIDGADLSIGGVTSRALAKDFGTPVYVYDASVVRRAFADLKGALSGFAEVFFSIKANPNPAIAALLITAGAGVEVASAGELRLALRAGAQPARILAAGPGKTRSDIQFFIEKGIGEIHLESFSELDVAAAEASARGRVQPVSIRVNPSASAGGGAMRMGGKPAVFGFDEEMLPQVVRAVAARPSLRLAGIHLFAGTQILDRDVLLGQWSHALDLAARMAQVAGRPVDSIDLGGGLGIPYFPGDSPVDLVGLKAGLHPLIRRRRDDPALASARIMVEPGRFLVGESGVYLASITSLKQSRGQIFAVTDGGMHHHLAASGNLGQVVKRDFPMVAAGRMDEVPAIILSVAGPLCTPIDLLARRAELPKLHVGDLVAVLQSGAYGLSASPIGFLSRESPAEVLVEDGTARLIRRRFGAETLYQV
jgi:diaminopimelate decarboxylase